MTEGLTEFRADMAELRAITERVAQTTERQEHNIERLAQTAERQERNIERLAATVERQAQIVERLLSQPRQS